MTLKTVKIQDECFIFFSFLFKISPTGVAQQLNKQNYHLFGFSVSPKIFFMVFEFNDHGTHNKSNIKQLPDAGTLDKKVYICH